MEAPTSHVRVTQYSCPILLRHQATNTYPNFLNFSVTGRLPPCYLGKSIPPEMWILRPPFSLRSLFQPSLPSLHTLTYSSPFPSATWTSVKTTLTISTFSSPCFTTWPGFQSHKFMETALRTVTYLPTQKTMLTFSLPFKPPLPLVSETPFCPGFLPSPLIIPSLLLTP